MIWSARTAALEKVACEAEQLRKVASGSWDVVYTQKRLYEAIDALNAIQAPACREGDHE